MADEPASTFNIDEVLLPIRQRRIKHLPRLIVGSVKLVRRAARREFAIFAVVQIIGALALGGQLLAGKELLGKLIAAVGHRSAFGGLVPWLAALALATTVVTFTNAVQSQESVLLSELVSRYAIGTVLDVASAVELLAYDHPVFHDRMQRALLNSSTRPVQMAGGVLGLFSSGLAIVGIGGALLVLQPAFFAVVFLAYIPVWLASTAASRAGYRFTVEQVERDRRRFYLENLLSQKDPSKEMRAFNLGGFLRARHDELYDRRIADLRELVARKLRLAFLGGALNSLLTGLALAALAWFVTTSRASLASAGAAAGAVVLLGSRLGAFVSSASALYEGSLFLEDFTSFVGSLPSLEASRPTGIPPEGFTKLVVDDVTFCYPSRTVPSVRNVSLDLRQGEVVALVGENGSGKTTLAKLLAGLYQPDTGTITWDGVDLAGCDPIAVRDQVAVIFQDFLKYLIDVNANIGFGRHERLGDTDAIEASARRAGAHDFISALAQGYDTRMGPEFFGGSDLSIGQWQRVALARAFFRDAPFVILDEPTAALDPRAEADLFESIRDLLRDRAVLLITHRFASARSADRIYVLRDGAVVEQGTHADLMANDGLYAELFTMQAAGYIETES